MAEKTLSRLLIAEGHIQLLEVLKREPAVTYARAAIAADDRTFMLEAPLGGGQAGSDHCRFIVDVGMPLLNGWRSRPPHQGASGQDPRTDLRIGTWQLPPRSVGGVVLEHSALCERVIRRCKGGLSWRRESG